MLDFLKRFFNRRSGLGAARRTADAWIPKTQAGIRIDHDSAMQFSVVWACVRVIAESISQLPWRAMMRTERGNEVAPTQPADRLLYVAPNEHCSPAVWKELVMHDVLTWGNSYHEISFDGAGKPYAMYRIPPDRVEVRAIGNEVRYVVRDYPGEDLWFLPWEIFHVRGIGDELYGWSVIKNAANAIGLGKAQDESMASLIANESRPAALITPAGSLPKAAGERIREEWEMAYGGSGNRGRTAVLSHQMNYTPLALPNTDAQLLESRRFSVLEICRFFRVPPHKVFDLERATFSNIEHQAIEFVQDTLVPWIVKLEQEANRKLVSGTMQGRVFTKINVNALLRGDFSSRAKGYQLLFDRGVYSVNDILELEDRNTIGPDGDLRFVPLNFQTLERAAEPPQPPPTPAVVEPPPEEQDSEDEAIAAYRPILFDAIDRITSRECKLLERDKSADWVNAGHRGYIVNQLAPHAAALATFCGSHIDVAAIAEHRCEKLRAEIHGHLTAGGSVADLLTLWSDSVHSETDQILRYNYACN